MTTHGGPLLSIQSIIARQVGRNSHRKLKRKRIQNPEAYAAVVKENLRLGIVPQRKSTRAAKIRAMWRGNRRHMKVTLAKVNLES